MHAYLTIIRETVSCTLRWESIVTKFKKIFSNYGLLTESFGITCLLNLPIRDQFGIYIKLRLIRDIASYIQPESLITTVRIYGYTTC